MRFRLHSNTGCTDRLPAVSGTLRLSAAFCFLLLTCTLNNSTGDETNAPKSLTDLLTSDVRRGKVVDLLARPLDATWKCFSSMEAKPSEIWKIKDINAQRRLICLGKPKGFLYTNKVYSNFELTFEWMYPTDANGNSGVLIYTKNEPRLWPTSMQVQLHQPQAGALFASGDAISDKPFDAGLAGKIGKWNKCRIVSFKGQLFVEINDQKAGQAEGCFPASGHIGLQSEGSVTHFRKLQLTELTELTLADDDVGNSTSGGSLTKGGLDEIPSAGECL